MATRGRETVAPGEIVASDWGNAVWDQSVQAFDTAADRAAQFPVPQEGAVTYLVDSKALYLYRNGGWRILGAYSTQVTVTVPSGQTGASAVVTLPAGMFSAAPAVAVSANTRVFNAGASVPSATSVTVAIQHIDASTAGASVIVSLIATERGV